MCVISNIKDHHAYQNSWKKVIGENIMDKYTVAVLKDRKVVDYLNKEKPGRYAKTIFYSL